MIWMPSPIVHKRTFDPFEEPRADRILTQIPAVNCILIGTALEGAVKATALGLLLRQKNVTIVRDAVGTVQRPAMQEALALLESKNVHFIRTADLVRQAQATVTCNTH